MSKSRSIDTQTRKEEQRKVDEQRRVIEHNSSSTNSNNDGHKVNNIHMVWCLSEVTYSLCMPLFFRNIPLCAYFSFFFFLWSAPHSFSTDKNTCCGNKKWVGCLFIFSSSELYILKLFLCTLPIFAFILTLNINWSEDIRWLFSISLICFCLVFCAFRRFSRNVSMIRSKFTWFFFSFWFNRFLVVKAHHQSHTRPLNNRR